MRIKQKILFLKINQLATKISDAELELIQNRNDAYAIAARAIVRAGRGYNMQNVVLDALIPREDFEIASDIGNRGNT